MKMNISGFIIIGTYDGFGERKKRKEKDADGAKEKRFSSEFRKRFFENDSLYKLLKFLYSRKSFGQPLLIDFLRFIFLGAFF